MLKLSAAGLLWLILANSGAADPAAQPPPHIADLTLPVGALQMEAGSDTTITFLDRARTAKSGDEVTVWAFQVFDPGVPTALGLAVQIVQRRTIDCRAKTKRDTGSVAYNAAGNIVMWLPGDVAEPIEPNSPSASEFVVICAGGALPTPVVTGHHAALAAGRAFLKARR